MATASRGTGAAEYSWEKEYERTWDVITEDEEGNIRTTDIDEDFVRRRRIQQAAARRVKRGLIRYMYIVIDRSFAAREHKYTLGKVQNFLGDFFAQNPISNVGIVVMASGTAELLTELSSNKKTHIRALEAEASKKPEGAMSFQIGLEMAAMPLSFVPSHGCREILLLHAGKSSVDPTDIFATIRELKEKKIRCSVISIDGEMYLAKKLAQDTGGSYRVPLHPRHLDTLLSSIVPPPPLASVENADLVEMGFPYHEVDAEKLCVCHSQVKAQGFTCPRCGSRVCDLPKKCPVCALELVSAPQLARSYHHLFPVPIFKESNTSKLAALEESKDTHMEGDGSPPTTPSASTPAASVCFGCQVPFTSDKDMRFACPKCRHVYCAACDMFIHEVLHNCPGERPRDIEDTGSDGK